MRIRDDKVEIILEML